ncbi:MAG TPA: hypothetical protein VGO58_07105 [Chitinophagaceae bacterium]|jgi:hypothetical protein|nr:hypothetical protein [Chitinophagaceae bacterium]
MFENILELYPQIRQFTRGKLPATKRSPGNYAREERQPDAFYLFPVPFFVNYLRVIHEFAFLAGTAIYFYAKN